MVAHGVAKGGRGDTMATTMMNRKQRQVVNL
jgi:hypothetical protein